MEQAVLGELHDAKLKMVKAINSGDKELATKYQEVVHNLEKALELLRK